MRAEWAIKPLGEACEFQRGLTYAKTDEVDVSSNTSVLMRSRWLTKIVATAESLLRIVQSIDKPARV